MMPRALLILLIACGGPAAPPPPVPVAESGVEESAEESTDAGEVERPPYADLIQLMELATALAAERGQAAPENVAAAFDAFRYRDFSGVLPASVLRTQLALGHLGIRQALLSALGGSAAETRVEVRQGPPSLQDSAAFVQADFPARADSAERRAQLIALANVHVTALLDRLGGPGWDALQSAHPSAAALDAYQPWMFPVSIEQLDAHHVRLGLAPPPTPDADPAPLVMFGACLSALRTDVELRARTGIDTDRLAGYELCISGVLSGLVRDTGNIPEPETSVWALPWLATMEGMLRGFVVAEIVARYAPEGLLGLADADLVLGAEYLRQLHAPSPRLAPSTI